MEVSCHTEYLHEIKLAFVYCTITFARNVRLDGKGCMLYEIVLSFLLSTRLLLHEIKIGFVD